MYRPSPIPSAAKEQRAQVLLAGRLGEGIPLKEDSAQHYQMPHPAFTWDPVETMQSPTGSKRRRCVKRIPRRWDWVAERALAAGTCSTKYTPSSSVNHCLSGAVGLLPAYWITPSCNIIITRYYEPSSRYMCAIPTRIYVVLQEGRVNQPSHRLPIRIHSKPCCLLGTVQTPYLPRYTYSYIDFIVHQCREIEVC